MYRLTDGQTQPFIGCVMLETVHMNEGIYFMKILIQIKVIYFLSKILFCQFWESSIAVQFPIQYSSSKKKQKRFCSLFYFFLVLLFPVCQKLDIWISNCETRDNIADLVHIVSHSKERKRTWEPDTNVTNVTNVGQRNKVTKCCSKNKQLQPPRASRPA